MQNTTERSSRSAEGLYKFFIYFVLVLLAVIIIVPVAWVFMASIKQNAEFYGNPWALPAGFYWQNFVNAWNGAKMGEYMLNSVIVTALALVLLLVIALPAAYCLSRFRFKGRKLLNTLFMAGLFINVNYIVVPIFLMLRDGDVWLKSHFGSSFLLNNLVVLAVVYAATALPFTIYLLSGYFATLPHDLRSCLHRRCKLLLHHDPYHLPCKALHHHHHPVQLPVLLERVHYFHDADELHQRAPHPAGGPFESDAGPAERGPVRHHVCRSGAGDAAHPDPVHLRAEAADTGYDRGRSEG
mgnify:CR=1 FL=1